MSPSEIAFLALGLVLGGALGAAFLVVGRARPAHRREVRITIVPNSIGARRSVTLADPTATWSRPSPPGSPDDAAWPNRAVAEPPMPAAALAAGPVPVAPLRTRVPSAPAWVSVTAVAVPVGQRRPAAGLGRIALTASRNREQESGAAPHVRSTVAVLDVGRADPVRLARSRQPVPDPRPHLVPTSVGIPIDPEPDARVRMASAERSGKAAPSQGFPSGSVDPCAPVRTLSEERCAEAMASREAARAAGDAMRRAQREVDALRERIDRAQETSDPRAIDAAKAALHATFREANARAKTAEEAEAAARRWLSGIDRANTDARAALRSGESGAAALREQLPELERLAGAAHAARITAETAEEACRTAREVLARCEEAAAAAPPAADAPHPFATVWPTEADLSPVHGPSGVPAETMAGLPAIVRMLRGDREARDRVVTMLAGDDRTSIAAWQLRMSAFVDAIAARAIEACFLDLPDDEPFWALFGQKERRDIVEALSSLGFRFDGISGFADGRAPSARDLSLAVGYAGLDPMRVRIWPRDAELGALYDRATVSADEWLATEADDLALGTVVDALGHRAADLGELWDAWGRIRPLLLATS